MIFAFRSYFSSILIVSKVGVSVGTIDLRHPVSRLPTTRHINCLSDAFVRRSIHRSQVFHHVNENRTEESASLTACLPMANHCEMRKSIWEPLCENAESQQNPHDSASVEFVFWKLLIIIIRQFQMRNEIASNRQHYSSR